MSNVAGGNILERFGLIATIDPDAYATGAQTSDIVDMRYWEEIAVWVLAGDLGSSATLACTTASSANSNMSSPTTLTGKAITTLTDANTDSNKQAAVRITAEEVAANGTSHRYVQATMTVAVATSDCAAVIYGAPSAYAPVSGYDLSSVAELVM